MRGAGDALGTSRVLEVPAGVQVGKKSFPQTLALKPGEVVLTFDDVLAAHHGGDSGRAEG